MNSGPGLISGIKKEEPVSVPANLTTPTAMSPLKAEPMNALGPVPAPGFLPPQLGQPLSLATSDLPLEPKREPLDASPATAGGSAFGAPPRASPSKALPRASPRPSDEGAMSQPGNVFVKQELQSRR